MIRITALLLAVLVLSGCAAQDYEDQAPPQETSSQTVEQIPHETGYPTSEERISTVGFYFDTVVTIIVFAKDENVLDAALNQCAYYENLLSKTIEGSDVWRINNAKGQPVEVSKHTRSLLETSLRISEASGGKFDITIAPVMALWDFTGTSAILPDEVDIKKAAELVDYSLIELDGSTVRIPDGYMIDLGAIAKGYIADEVAACLKGLGVEHGILNFGGNVVVLGDKPDGTPWNVGIQDPKGPVGTNVAIVKATDSTVVTSGIYERGFDLNNIRYHHILDTETGWPVQNDLASVTILTKSSAFADALSTACLALGHEAAVELLSEFEDVEAVFITREGEITATDGAWDVLTIDS